MSAVLTVLGLMWCFWIGPGLAVWLTLTHCYDAEDVFWEGATWRRMFVPIVLSGLVSLGNAIYIILNETEEQEQ